MMSAAYNNSGVGRSDMGESYQDRVRYYRRQREQARAEKYRRDSQEKYSNIDFDEALYRFKNKSQTEKMFDEASRRAKHYTQDFVKGFSDRHLSDHLAWYRDDEQGIIGGVCAGIADKMNWQVTHVRIGAVISGLIFTLPTLVTYAAATYFLRNKGLAYRGRKSERDFWRSAGRKTNQNRELDAEFEELRKENFKESE